MLDLGFHVWLIEIASLAGVLAGIVVGAIGLQVNSIALHRAGMILLAAGFFCNASQRFFWAVFGKLNYLGPYKTFQQFMQGPTAASVYTAIVFNYGAALALILSGLNVRDTAQQTARINRLKKKV